MKEQLHRDDCERQRSVELVTTARPGPPLEKLCQLAFGCNDEQDDVLKAWRFRIELIGYGDDAEDAWANLLEYRLAKEPAPPYERVPEHDLNLDDNG